MWIYNLKLAIRTISKHSKFFVISVLSLVIGITASSLLGFHIMYENSFDGFYKQTDQLYRINYNVIQGGSQVINSCRTQPGLSWALPSETDLIEASCCAYYEDCYMYTDDVKLYNQKVIWADNGIFDVFQHDMILGDPSGALTGKYSVVISDKTAEIYFGQSDPIGKTIRLNEGMEFSVTGVFRQFPENSHLSYDFITSFVTLEDYGLSRQNNWGFHMVSTYIRKKEDATVSQIEHVLANMKDKYLGDRMERDQEITFSLMPVKDIYLRSDLEGEFKPQGNSVKITLLTVIALFIIFIAWTNNINISTAMSLDRAKESGIRKIHGASKKALVTYFITESFIINLVSVFLAVVVLLMSVNAFKTLVNGAIVDNFMFQKWFLAAMGSFLVVGVIFTGTVPALIQSSFNPLRIMKNEAGGKTRLGTLRTSLSVFQFTLAILLISSTLFVFKQLKYLESRDLGIKAEQVLVLRAPATNNTSGERRYAEFRAFRQDIMQFPYFKSVTASTNVPGQTNRFNNILVSRNNEQIDASFNMSQADEHYFETYQVPIVAGRNFYDDMTNERTSIIINEQAVEVLGFESAALSIGQKIGVGNAEREIIGVVQNFHHESLQKEIEPYFYGFSHPGEFGYYPVLVSTDNIPELINTAEEIWEKHYPDALFEYFFLDEFFNRQYASYHQLGTLVGISSILAIFIACLGLFVFVYYQVNKKVKEIGIRKVNGAKVSEILAMLNKNFIRWVFIAFVIATPIAWFAMDKWLQNFAYKTGLSWWIFALAGIMALGIALFTVSWQSYRAASRNPVEALRYE